MLEATFTFDLARTQRLLRVMSRRSFLDQTGLPAPSRLTTWMLRAFVGLTGGLGVMLVIVAVTSGDRIQPWQMILVAVLAYVSGGFAVIFFGEYRNQRILARLFDVSGVVTYSLEPDGLRAVSGVSRSFFPWAGFRQVLVSDEFIMMICGGTVLSVPISAFPDEAAMHAFAAYASARVREQGVDALDAAQGDARMSR